MTSLASRLSSRFLAQARKMSARDRAADAVAVLTEVATDWAVGVFPLPGPAVAQAITGAMRPGLSCGLAIAAVRHLARGRDDALALPHSMSPWSLLPYGGDSDAKTHYFHSHSQKRGAT
jgi:hypothetical protein